MSEDGAKLETIGLLFVHGIGEQKRFENLRDNAQQFAELMQQAEPNASVTIVDRTDNWPYPAGCPAPDGETPIILTYRSPRRHVRYECHEVWWADLGARSGILDVVTFWLWGLGQWGAPIYREIDASALPKDAQAIRADGKPKPVPSMSRLPTSVAGQIVGEPWARLRLALAGLAALLVAASWMLAKKLFQAVLGQSPSPTLLVQYVGDVRTYESRATPGDSSLTDPGHPRRVGIRRRMVSEMVAMGARTHLDGWYVCAHSLGTIVAYNGLTEIGHTLPNYLSEAQWGPLPGPLKADDNCKLREPGDLYSMMPSRPDWLRPTDVINRKLLFEKLYGVLTFGSPLDKFAALWPRIVATATDRIDDSSAFPSDCEWLNLASPHDPVAGPLNSFDAGPGTALGTAVPQVINWVTPIGWDFGLAHIRYFSGVVRDNARARTAQKRAVMNWLLGDLIGPDPLVQRHPVVTRVIVMAGYVALVALLWIFTTGLWMAVTTVAAKLLGAGNPFSLHQLSLLLHMFLSVGGGVLGMGMTIITGFGLWRWLSESMLNVKEAVARHADAIVALDRLPGAASRTDHDKAEELVSYWKWIGILFYRQVTGGVIMLAVWSLFTVLAIMLHLWPMPDRDIGGLAGVIWHMGAILHDFGWPLIMLKIMLISSIIQALVNRAIPGATKPTG